MANRVRKLEQTQNSKSLHRNPQGPKASEPKDIKPSTLKPYTPAAPFHLVARRAQLQEPCCCD